MTATDYPDPPTGRPLWLVTLADLALLLVGFFVLIQATGDRRALASGLRQGFGGQRELAIPVAAAGTSFAAGSAAPADTAALVAWARDAARDPRVTLTVTGSVDGTPADVDPTTGSAAVLAADRARAVAALLAPVTSRLTVAADARPGRRATTVTLAFAGEPKEKP